MKARTIHPKTRSAKIPLRLLGLSLVLFSAAAAFAQTPVDDDGNPLGPVYSDADDPTLDEVDIQRLGPAELETLVGPIALYPDDLLAIVLPASTYPLEIVQAARYLEELDNDSSLQPDESWDDSVVALLNYPEVLRMMSDDIDWTWRLGEAVIAQQSDVVAAVESFRDRAYAAGNLKSDKRQTVTRNDEDVIVIDPVEDDVIYVPYYEPERVVVYQPRPVYHYYTRPYPVYYYPYPAGYHFSNGYFWGVTTAFRVGWTSNHLHVYHHSYHGHPYFGWNYYGNFWRRPSVYVFNNWYGSWGYRNARDRYRYGSYWRPRRHGGARPVTQHARSRYYSNSRRSYSEDGYADRDRRREQDRRRHSGNNGTVLPRRQNAENESRSRSRSRSEPVTPRQVRRANRNADRNPDNQRTRRAAADRDPIRFRSRDRSSSDAANDATRRTASGRGSEPGNRRIAPNRQVEGASRQVANRQRVDEARRSVPRSSTARNRTARAEQQQRLAQRQQVSRRDVESRSRTAARPPVAIARRNEPTARRAQVRPAPRRDANVRTQRAPAPRASNNAPRSAPAAQRRPVSSPPPQRSTSKSPRPARAERKIDSGGGRQSSRRSNDRRRRN